MLGFVLVQSCTARRTGKTDDEREKAQHPPTRGGRNRSRCPGVHAAPQADEPRRRAQDPSAGTR
jgi:hypothetical protein